MKDPLQTVQSLRGLSEAARLERVRIISLRVSSWYCSGEGGHPSLETGEAIAGLQGEVRSLTHEHGRMA
jgi:hypothetical protein